MKYVKFILSCLYDNRYIILNEIIKESDNNIIVHGNNVRVVYLRS